MGMLRGDPQSMAQQMMRTNPQFAEFVRRNQGKSPDQIAQEHGIDFGAVQSAMSKFTR
jgi:hypothetical protein